MKLNLKYAKTSSFIGSGEGISYPLLDVLCDMDSVERSFFKIIYKARDKEDGYSYVCLKEVAKDDSTYNRLTSAGKRLKKLNLIKRVKGKKNTYLINPDAVLPIYPNNLYLSLKDHWDKL